VYSDAVLDHFRNPRNAGVLRDPDGVGEAENPVCGDLAKISIRVADGRVAEARFQTYGCGPSIAAASVGTELVRQMTLDDALALAAEEIEVALGGLPPDRKHAADVVAEAIHAAVENHLRRRGASPKGGTGHA
jgi:nitrogen fixation NifU-like protein